MTVSGLTQPGGGLALAEECANLDGVQAVTACMAGRFTALVDEDQKAQVLLPMTAENAVSWSNLPCGSSCRVGIELSDLDEGQRQAALGLVLAVSGSGFDEITQVLMADDILTLAQEEGIASQPGGPGGGLP